MARQELELAIAPYGTNTKVLVDGQDVSENFEQVSVLAEVGRATRVELTYLKTRGEPYTVKGCLLTNDEAKLVEELELAREVIKNVRPLVYLADGGCTDVFDEYDAFKEAQREA